jgi:GT2 family glycosyltransferase
MGTTETKQDRPPTDVIVSVLICTRNRCDRLALALNSLGQLKIPHGVSLEILLVDNGSTDTTAAQVKIRAAHCSIPLRYIFEPEKGKSIALNTGIRAASGHIVAFTDDDCIVDPLWIEAITTAFAAKESPDVLGGRVELYNPQDAPLTLAVGDIPVVFSSARQLFPDPLIIGANLAVRRNVFTEIGGFDPLLGPGTSAISEDVDFVYRAYTNGFTIYYKPDILVYHNHGRQSKEELVALSYRYNTGRGAFYFKHFPSWDFVIAKMLFSDLKCSAFRIIKFQGVRFEFKFLCALFLGMLSRISGQFTRHPSNKIGASSLSDIRDIVN